MKPTYRYLIIALFTLLTVYFSIEIKALIWPKMRAASERADGIPYGVHL